MNVPYCNGLPRPLGTIPDENESVKANTFTYFYYTAAISLHGLSQRIRERQTKFDAPKPQRAGNSLLANRRAGSLGRI